MKEIKKIKERPTFLEAVITGVESPFLDEVGSGRFILVEPFGEMELLLSFFWISRFDCLPTLISELETSPPHELWPSPCASLWEILIVGLHMKFSRLFGGFFVRFAPTPIFILTFPSDWSNFVSVNSSGLVCCWGLSSMLVFFEEASGSAPLVFLILFLSSVLSSFSSLGAGVAFCLFLSIWIFRVVNVNGSSTLNNVKVCQ